MKKLFGIIIIAFLCYTQANAQWEYQYFSIRVGANHNFLSPKPGNFENAFLQTEIGDMPLFPNFKENSKYSYYGIGVTGDVFFHYDLTNNKIGFALGLQYANNSMGAQYFTQDGKYNLTEKYRVHSLGIPLMIKVSPDIYTKQFYLFAGAQYNINMASMQTRTVDWSPEVFSRILLPEELETGNIGVFLGLNYQIYNIEIGMVNGSFLIPDYTNGEGYAIHSNQKGNIFYAKTSLTLPISEWIFLNSWTAEKIRRMFKSGE